MPWGVLIIGIFLFGGASLLLNTLITGTSAIELAIKNFAPWALGAVYFALMVFGLFGGKHGN